MSYYFSDNFVNPLFRSGTDCIEIPIVDSFSESSYKQQLLHLGNNVLLSNTVRSVDSVPANYQLIHCPAQLRSSSWLRVAWCHTDAPSLHCACSCTVPSDELGKACRVTLSWERHDTLPLFAALDSEINLSPNNQGRITEEGSIIYIFISCYR